MAIQECIVTVLKSCLQHVAKNKLGPTKTSRYFYLFFFTLASAYRWVSKGSPIQGVKDEWNWDESYPIKSRFDIEWFLLHVLQDTIHTFVPSFDTSILQRMEDEMFGWNDERKKETSYRILFESKYNLWKSKWTTWYASRQADGSIAASVPPSASDLPNGTQVLAVNETVDPATFSTPEAWTPLQINGKTQKYLTWNWLNVRSTCLTDDDQTNLFTVANTSYPNTSQRNSEIGEVVSITNTITDLQKCTAEFWAGGAKTVSPPGMFIYFWRQFIFLEDPSLQTLIYSGFELALSLFEVGRLVWGLKKQHMEARPIQEIRRLYRGQTLKKYDGTNILGEEWVPYQETNFVTPPFADFPSGHSAFSQTFAKVMTKYFGATIPLTDVNHVKDLSLICPSIHSQAQCFGVFIFPENTSEIQSGVPASDITLRWDTWQDMANSAGISRKYGGIHATSAHTGSQDLANSLFTVIQTRFFA
jgi:hypothetical protein